jgi:endonuclease/exonuclease/phosphatase family metal-dependent hydrolase
VLRIVSYNIRFGGGRRITLLGATLASLEPDVVLLQEATNPVAMERLALETGLSHVLQQPGWSVASLSKVPMRSHAWHRPVKGRGFLEVEPEGADVRLIDLHLPAGLSLRGERARLRHVDGLLQAIGGADDRTFLIGDLNAVAPGDEPRVASMPFWLRMLLRFDGGIRTDVMRRLDEAGWVDAYRRLHPKDAGFTLPPGAPAVRLDYLLVPPAALHRVLACEPADDAPLVARASDHLPLVVDLET